MFRYIVLICSGNHADRLPAMRSLTAKIRSSMSRTWAEISADDITVFHLRHGGPLKPHVLCDGKGVLLGCLFNRGHELDESMPAGLATLDTHFVQRTLTCRGKNLVTDYWGNYAVILREPEEGKAWILKDPTGSLPCYFYTSHGVLIVFSCLADFMRLGLVKLTVNQSYLAHRVATGGFDARFDALNEVSQIRRGECVSMQDRDGALRPISRDLYWSPIAFGDAAYRLGAPTVAARALRSAVRTCVNAWADQYGDFLIRLSGGLDSSIVAGCISRSPKRGRVLSYTYHNPQGGSDERRWARMAAQHSGISHVERSFDPASISLGSMLSMAPTFEPISGISYLQRGPVEREFARREGMTAVFSGDGGDSGFGSECIGLALDVYLDHFGFGTRGLALAEQIATIRESTIARVLFGALRRKLLGSTAQDHAESRMRGRKLLTEDVRRLAFQYERYPHPWFAALESVPWHTIYSLGALMISPEFYDPFAESESVNPELVAPLYAQPVVEICLRIPLYLHFFEGRDRGLARKAFSAEVPHPIIRRRWKDRAPGYFEELMLRESAFFREILLNGRLVNKGLLDRRAVESALSGRITNHAVEIGELFNHLDVELWLQKFENHVQDRVAA